MIDRILRAAAAALVFSSSFAFAQSVPGEPSRSAKAAAAPQLLLGPDTSATRVALAAPSEAELAKLRDSNRATTSRLRPNAMRINIGIERGSNAQLAAPAASAWHWQSVAGGKAAQLAVTSPGAEAMRVAIDLTGVPLDVQVRFAGSATGRVEGPVRVGAIADRTDPWWSPVTEGETLVLEVFAPEGVDASALALRPVRVAHLLATPSAGLTKRLADIGLSGSCNVDVQCSPLNGDAGFRNIVEATTQIVFQDGSLTALCTGTLLNDSDASSQIPWVYTANHCFENENAPYKTPAQLQTVANTVTTIWGFEARTCGSVTPRADWTQVGGGSQYVSSDARGDVLLIRLNGAPPSYAFYAGWDASGIAVGTAVVSVHHPEGDLKKVSEGSVQSLRSFAVVNTGSGSFIEVLWSTGTTEPGSSGAGVFSRSSSPAGNQYLLRGGLWGGTALCTNRSGTDNFSRFDLVYPQLSPYLGTGAPSGGPTTDFTDLWWAGAAEDGWGLNLIQHASRIVFGVWYTYDTAGKRTWFVFSDGVWTGQNVYSAQLYTVAGPPQNGAFDPSRVRRTSVGNVVLTFTGANNGTMQWTVNGQSGTKAITRYAF